MESRLCASSSSSSFCRASVEIGRISHQRLATQQALSNRSTAGKGGSRSPPAASVDILDHGLQCPRAGHQFVLRAPPRRQGARRGPRLDPPVRQHPRLEDAETLAAAGLQHQQAELRHVPFDDMRKAADAVRLGRRAHFLARLDAHHAERRVRFMQSRTMSI